MVGERTIRLGAGEKLPAAVFCTIQTIMKIRVHSEEKIFMAMKTNIRTSCCSAEAIWLVRTMKPIGRGISPDITRRSGQNAIAGQMKAIKIILHLTQ